MIKLNSPDLYNSGASSETSESQSVEENTIGVGASGSVTSHKSSRSSKAWKHMKGSGGDKDAGDTERPPWRAVSLSTLPKPDKNAILRAKLLDASRRLRAGKTAIAVQTDLVPTKLMKEVSLGPQTDLQRVSDVGVVTDGSFTDYTLSYSVSQMTEGIPKVKNASTQTLLYKVLSYSSIEGYIRSDVDLQYPSDVILGEPILLQQIRSLPQAKFLRPLSVHRNREKTFIRPKYCAWHLSSDEEDELCTDPPVQAFPWIPLTEADSGRNSLYTESNSNCNGINLRNYRAIDFNILLSNAIDELILESNKLVDLIEELDATTDNHQNPSHTPIFPSDYWLAVIDKEEKDLAEKISTLKDINIRAVNKFSI